MEIFPGQKMYRWIFTNICIWGQRYIWLCKSNRKIELDADFTVKIEAYNNVGTIKEQEFTGKLEVTEKINDIVDFNLVCTKEISKGYIYANYDAKEK